MKPVDPCKSLEPDEVHCAAEIWTNSPPLVDFVPEVDNTSPTTAAIRWVANENGHRIAVAFSALGFVIVEEQTHYHMPLDTETDRLLLRLYDLIAGLRWRHPHRQLALFGVGEVADD